MVLLKGLVSSSNDPGCVRYIEADWAAFGNGFLIIKEGNGYQTRRLGYDAECNVVLIHTPALFQATMHSASARVVRLERSY